jgi:hypothetical protein
VDPPNRQRQTRRLLWTGPLGCIVGGVGAAVLVFALGFGLVALFGRERAYAGDPNDGEMMLVAGAAMFATPVGATAGVWLARVRDRRRIAPKDDT